MSAFLSSLRPGLRMANAAQTARAFSTSPAHSIARLTLTGRLGAEPELHATSSGQEVVKYNVATSHGSKDNRQTSWFRIINFVPEGPQRDYILGLQKGTLLYVEGDARMNTYEDAEGHTRSSLSVVQRTLEVLKRPENHSGESR
ncbi:Primosome PriB/single-strand DNA-binding [Penicillium paradoxum]|uniref:Primosome PriB/single-strand DNA-binding n=1 Tax=Penicillium paradoxum TaxID=176176 RepID=UPI002548F2CC|nr:Primosome PriB/single-strand DNA-binding [Penicillium paradoxum]KAJ5794850.1 Primosome PriB/single-strand DNA-binding [Penicillium paradoxum]